SSAGDFAPAPSHTTGRAVFRIRRLNAAALYDTFENDLSNMKTPAQTTRLRAETAVKQRYASAARATEPALCCPVEYNTDYLKIIPPEVIEKDYGCGDPSRYVKPGETVLDLGSGTGKICFIAAQVVGAKGRVIGVDMTDEMLQVARRNAPIVAEGLGYANVEFRKGRIQDLALDLELLDCKLKAHPIASAASFLAAEELRITHPLVATD